MSLIIANKWMRKAAQNRTKWGDQDKETLVMAMMEELGELTQAILQFNELFPADDSIYIDIPLVLERQQRYEHIREELDDLAPLMFQLEAVL